MKKFVSLLLALMMALGMTALAEESKDQLARIQERAKLSLRRRVLGHLGRTRMKTAIWSALMWKLRRRLRRSWA